MGFTLSAETLRRLAALVEENGLSELRYEQGDVRVTLRTGAYNRPVTGAPMFFSSAVAANGEAAPSTSVSELSGDGAADQEVADAADTDLMPVAAPIMGVFYRSPNPDSPPFVEIGDTVEAGQVIGLIEAMKTFNEVPSEVAGRVRAISAQSGALVSPGDPLILLEME